MSDLSLFPIAQCVSSLDGLPQRIVTACCTSKKQPILATRHHRCFLLYTWSPYKLNPPLVRGNSELLSDSSLHVGIPILLLDKSFHSRVQSRAGFEVSPT